MKIVIDARLWSESGIGRYIRNLINGLQNLDPTNEYLILLLKKDFEKTTFRNNNFKKILADFNWYSFGEQIKLPGLLKSLNPDLVHFPHFNVPIFYKGKFVVTIHDLIHQHFQTRETSTRGPIMHNVKKIGYKKAFSYAISRSAKIITPSVFIKNQLMDEWRVGEEKIIVTHEAVEEGFISDMKKALGKSDFPKPYLFYVGNAQPHKNILSLIETFEKLKEKYPKLSLILSGPQHAFWDKIKKVSNPRNVIFTGFVSEKKLINLYQNAEIFVIPSLEEGFGLPVLEAMVCGCPVVSSNVGSLVEVGGGAALYFDPKNEGDMEEKISLVLDNRKLRSDLIAKGEKRYKQFSWQKLAEQTSRIYQEA